MNFKGLDDTAVKTLKLLLFLHTNAEHRDQPLVITPGQLARNLFSAKKEEVERVVSGDVLEELEAAGYIQSFSVVETPEGQGDEAGVAYAISMHPQELAASLNKD